MRRTTQFLVAAAIAAAAGLGYWLGRTHPAPDAAQVHQGAGTGAPGVGDMAGGAGSAPAAGPGTTAPDARRILYYRNPMGLPDTSPVPKKDSMGMDYVPVYEGEEPAGTGFSIPADKLQMLGVRTEAAGSRDLSRALRAVGMIQTDERLQHTVAPRFEGWIQRLLVNTTGQAVQRGEPLMEVYSPELVAAQQEYLVAARGVERLKDAAPEFQASMRALVEGSLQRLRNWDIGEADIARLREGGKPLEALLLRAPAGGVVLDKPSVQGMRFMPGEVLYRIADLSAVWLIAEVFEQDLALVRTGQAASVRLNAYPGRTFAGRVAFVYPAIAAETRTARVRIELANPGELLKPAMYANVEIASGSGRVRVAVPDSAVIDSGTRQLVLVKSGDGRFAPRDVKLGLRGDTYVEVLEGVKAGEEVVVAANFLIDAESNLRAAVSGFGDPAAGSAAKSAPAAHEARGTVQAIDPKSGSVSVAHEPVASLGWPAMTMDFKVRDRRLLEALKPGGRIGFRFEESAPGEWVIVRIDAAQGAGATAGQRAAPPEAHQGH